VASVGATDQPPSVSVPGSNHTKAKLFSTSSTSMNSIMIFCKCIVQYSSRAQYRHILFFVVFY